MSEPNQGDPQTSQQIAETQNGGGEAENQQQNAPQTSQQIAGTQNGGGGEAENQQRNAPQRSDLQATISKIDENLQQYLKLAFVLANLYYFFQGAILTAVSQVSSPKCSQRYFFLVLSLIPFVLNGFPLIYVLHKCANAKNERDMYTILSHRMSRVARNDNEPVQIDVYWKMIRYIGVGIAGFVLVGFNAVMLYGCQSLLCDNQQSSPNISFNGDCFRVCNDQNKCLQICTQ